MSENSWIEHFGGREEDGEEFKHEIMSQSLNEEYE